MPRPQLIVALLSTNLFLTLVGCEGTTVETIAPKDGAVAKSPEVEIQPGDWPWWRGPSGNSHGDDKSIPLEWNNDHLKWKTPVPGQGYASPTVVGDLVVLATSDEGAGTQSLMAFDRQSGELRWNRQLHQGSFPVKHGTNTHASATAASDRENFYSAFAIDQSIQVSAVNREGNIVWQKTAGPFGSRHGYGSSPVIYRSLVIVAGDSDSGAFLAGLNRADGEIVWRISRPNNGSYCSPMVARLNGRDQLLVSGNLALVSYDPATGQELWRSEGPATTTANTVTWNDSSVFVSGGYPERAVMAVSSDGSGEVQWKLNQKLYVPSPLLIGNQLLIVQDNGIAQLLAADTGKVLWKNRLGGSFYGSPVVNQGTVFVGDRSGYVYAFKVDPEFQLISKVRLDAGISTTPSICNGEVFVRTDQSLYCFSMQDGEANQ